jgi:hypothetical protein
MEDIFESLKSFKVDINQTERIEQRELFVAEAIKRNSTFVKCSHCSVVGNEPNMMRWHFHNCQSVLKNCKQCGEIIPRQGIKPFIYDKKNYCNRKCYMASKKGKAPIVMTDEIKDKLSKIALSQSKERSERVKRSKPWETRWKKKVT